MSDEGSIRQVMLSVEAEDCGPGSTKIYAVDVVNGEKTEIIGISHATILIDPDKPPTVHLEVIPDKINIPGILERMKDYLAESA